MILDFMGRRPLSVWDHVVSIKDGSYYELRSTVSSTMDSPNFGYFILLLGTVLYRNHMVPGRNGSAAHEIQNH